MDVSEEARIIGQVQAGSRDDFAYLVHRYKSGLFRIVGNLVDSPQVEDIVQETFIAAFTHICRYEPERGSFCTWLYSIARNLALNARKKKCEQPLPESLVIADERTPADDAQKSEIFRRLDQALDGLRFQDRVIFVLADLEGLSYAEIARIEGLRIGTVKSRLARARARLKNALESYVG
ncbi:MAG: RNA polymerase sigma factor [Syntrophobacteraceae bacterium]